MIKLTTLLLCMTVRTSFAIDGAKQQNRDINKESEQQWEEDRESNVKDQSSQIKKLKRQLRITTFQNRGLDALLQGDPEKARTAYDAVIDLSPDNVEAYLYRASARTETKDAQGALADFATAIIKQKQWLQSHPDASDQARGKKMLARIYGSRGVAYMNMALNSKTGSDLLNKALVDFDQALAVGHPRPSLITWEKSQVLAALQRWQEASELYQKALTEDPNRKNSPSHKLFCTQFADHGVAVGVCS